ncbi:MAG: hypothetical protein IPJ82_17265 [Lewinellaceae bacterium]|nr:hypothetical protein [Lewinellaceae bacterium]
MEHLTREAGKQPAPVQYLCIGHCCHDIAGDKTVLGGTASYAALAAGRLGKKAGILTSVGPEFEFFKVFEQAAIPVFNKPAPSTTVFENIYHDGQRTQYLHERASVLNVEDVPEVWRATPVVQFCPIADEVDFSLLPAFPDALTAATIQGWLRQWDSQGKVSPKTMDWFKLSAVDIVVMSDADIAGFETAIPEIAANVRILVITQGAYGARVFQQGDEQFFPSFPVREVDATGAGDVFATAFILKYAETKDAATACAFAHVAASFVVEGVGIDNLDALEKIRERLKEYQSMFGAEK